MSYRVDVVSRGEYLHLRVEGENSRETVAGYHEDVRQICIEEGTHYLLIEEHLTGPTLEAHEIYELISDATSRWSPLRRLAYVDTAPEHDLSMMEFAETVALNRGGRMKLWRTVAEARDWLLEESGG